MKTRLSFLLGSLGSFALVAVTLGGCSGDSDGVAQPQPAGTTSPNNPSASSSSSSSSSGSTSSSSGSTSSGSTSSSGSSGTTLGPPATAADCDTFGTVLCQKLTTCNHIAAQMVGANCASRYAEMCKARIGAPSSGWTQTALSACGQAFTTATCDQALGPNPPAACVFKGGLAQNAQCAFDEQCQSGNCTGGENKCGTCGATKTPPTAAPQADLGQACDNSGQTAPTCNSAKGLWCDATKKCAPIPLVAIGQPCGFVGESLTMCSAGGRCDYGSTGSGTCIAETPVGSACTKADECAVISTCVAGKCGYPTAADICK